MRRTASVGVVALLILALAAVSASGDEICQLNPLGQLVCEDSGVITDPGDPGTDPPFDTGGLRYLHTRFDAGVECYYWSNVPGGIDTWDPANDPAVIGIVLSMAECPPIPAVDPETRAWEIFRSWDLALPIPSVEPEDHGITGLPTYLATNQPAAITHTEVLPDGRTLQVRAGVVRLTVDWGDGHGQAYPPEQALPFPDGAVTHTYLLKTCTPEYRENHPSGGLCHPTLDHYDIVVTFEWGGSYNVGSGWIDLGTLDRTAAIDYDVDELRGHPVPTP